MEEKTCQAIELPEGEFCGNCSTCNHYFPSKRDSQGRGYCGYYDTYYFPSDRNGCFNYSK